MQFISQPLLNLLIVFYHLLFNNLGLAIIGFTFFVRLVLLPLTLPSARMAQRVKELAPELEKIKKRHGKDRQKLMQAQADFYKKNNVNPTSGCLPQIVNIVVLIALFNGFSNVFKAGGDITAGLNAVLYEPLKVTGEIDKYFLGRDLTRPDVLAVGLPFLAPGVFLVLVSLLQFLSSKMSMPEASTALAVAKKTPGEGDDFAASMQKQMLYMFPLLTLVIGYNFPLAVVLYWGSFSAFQAVQQYFTSGWGPLKPLVQKLLPR